MEQKPKISLQQIADELNVSRITVSKVINNKEGVSEDTRRRVARKDRKSVV